MQSSNLDVAAPVAAMIQILQVVRLASSQGQCSLIAPRRGSFQAPRPIARQTTEKSYCAPYFEGSRRKTSAI